MKQIIFLVLLSAVFMSGCSKQGTEAAEAATSEVNKAVEVNAKTVQEPIGNVEAKVEEKAEEKIEQAEAPTNANQPFIGPQQFLLGQHFQRLTADVPKANPEKHEVVEVFWYGCIHCYNFEPIIEEWATNKKAADVEFVQMPAVWNERLGLHAKMYYVAKEMAVLDEMHAKIFKAMNEQKKRFASVEEITEFFAAHGHDEKNVKNLFNSFGVTSQVATTSAKVKKYGIEGTPEVIVNGRYRTSASMAGGQQKMIDVIEYLLKLKD